MMTVTLTPAVLLGFQTATPSPAAAGGAKATTAAPVVQPVLLAANMAAPPSTAFSLEEMLRNRAPAVIRASLMCIDEQTVFARLVAPSGGNAAQQRCGGSPEGLPDPAAPLESPRADASPSITNRDPSVDALSMLPEHDRSAATFAAVTPLDLPMTYGRIPGYRAAASHADDWGKWKTTETFSGAMPRSDLVLTPSAQAGGFNRDDWTAGPSAIDAMPAGSVSQGPSPVRASRAVAVRERPLKP
jgi:hypothetical protein